MLPSTEIVNPDTMQTGELERAAPEEAPPHASMTVTRDSPQPHSILPSPLVATTVSDYKFKHENEATDTTTSSEVDLDSDGEHKPPATPSSFPVTTMEHPINPNEQQANESVRSWLQRITAMQQEIQRKQHAKFQNHTSVNNVNLIGSSTNVNNNYQQPVVTPSRVVKYQDLPYMGEMTLDNSKPRRGRKPKKADICHLIYKNYGTIFPGTPKNIMDSQNEIKKVANAKSGKDQHLLEPVQRTNVQNRIISSLLEKRLTQESLRNKELLLSSQQATAAAAVAAANKFVLDTTTKHTTSTNSNSKTEEPLNLCIRDLNQLKIRLLRKHGNVYAASDNLNNTTEVKSEPPSDDDDVEFVDESPSPDSVIKPPILSLSPTACDIEANPAIVEARPGSGDIAGPGGYVYWPNAGVFIHPMALHSQLMYYQRLASGGNYTLPPGDNTILPPPPSPVDSTVSNSSNREYRKLVPKTPRQSLNQDTNQPSPSLSLEDSPDRNITPAVTPTPHPVPEHRVKRGASQGSNAPTKRKRSAIFIPPIPAENQTNPATEVSICKFKFTGGAKPSLQEKKMLSVDSGGNFRYYSGTGDKSMRGYEFFPRETLQQQAAAGSSHGSGTGAFLQASGEKIPLHPAGDQKGLPPDFMFAPDAPLQHQQLPPLSPELGGAMNSSRHRKRKTRKSLQREKLEQTFKEKGFLIQTQQLESAEGATYCKFRQLRKFTRYLFRSWKDYLPGSVRELQDNERTDEEEGLETPPAASVIVENEQNLLSDAKTAAV